MSGKNIIRAWKDEAYRMSLSEAERAMLPENPAGIVELSDAQLEGPAGAMGVRESLLCTLDCPTLWCISFLIKC
jgi:mersacidin/lichenicidin family type 2 lantibiotic